MISKTWRGILMTVLLVSSFTKGLALQVNDFTFSHIGKTEGLGNQRIFSICQTPCGTIWWSSKKGLGRYNGSMVKNYPLDGGTPYAHLGARVIEMVADSTRIFAYDNRSYLFEYNPIQDQFVPLLPRKLEHEGLNDVYVLGKKFYLAMYDGVYLLQDTTLTQLMKGASFNRIVAMNGNLLFCARDGVYTERGKRLFTYDAESGYYDEKTGLLWLGGYESGLMLVTMKGGEAPSSAHCLQLGQVALQNPIRCICPYDEETMLIGVDGLGVYQMRRDGTGPVSLLFDANESQHGVLHGNGVYSMVVDRWKNIVIGTYSGGIDIARPIGSTMAIYTHIPNNRQSLLNDHVNAVLTLSDQLVIGTDNGVSMLNTRDNTWRHCCQGMVVLGMCSRSDGRVLVCTYGKGIYEIDGEGNARQLYTVAGGQLTDDHVYALCYDRRGDLWIGSLNGDLLQMSAKGDIRSYPVHDVQTITQLPSGQIAVGTAFGLKLITPGSNKVEELNYAPKGVTDVNRFVNHLLVDGQKLWIATEGGGVYVWDLQKKEGCQLTLADGLPCNHVSNLVKGRDGRVWVATEEGLAFFSPDDPLKAVNVDYCYGLDREYARGAACNLSSGDILLGSTTGAVVIHPENVQALNYKATLQLKGIRCEVEQKERFNEQVHRMLADNQLYLDYDQRTFDLIYESVNMRNHFDIAYRYRMDDGEWSSSFTEQYIRFVSLEPGRHQLMLQCISRTSGTVIDTRPLTITIGHPWWSSWWMWCVYAVLLLLAFYGAWRVYELHEKYMRLTIDHLQTVETTPLQQWQEKENSSRLASEPAVPVGVSEPPVETSETSEAGKDFVDKASKLIVEHLSDSEFTIDRLCREMAMSRTLFYVKLKSYTGKSPQDFIRIIRLERAATLLRNGYTVTDAASLAGFDNPKYFSTVFKKYFGVSPSKYQ